MSSRDLAVKIALGVLWFAETSGLAILLVFLGGSSRSEGEAAFLVPAVLLTASLFARFVLIPMSKSLLPLILIYIAGIAICCAAGIYSLFLGRAYRHEVVVIAILCMTTYLPIFRLPAEKPNQPPQTRPTSGSSAQGDRG